MAATKANESRRILSGVRFPVLVPIVNVSASRDRLLFSALRSQKVDRVAATESSCRTGGVTSCATDVILA